MFAPTIFGGRCAIVTTTLAIGATKQAGLPLCRRFVSNHQLLNSCLQLRLESIQSQSNIESVNITTVSLSGSHCSNYTCTMNRTVIVNDHISTAGVLWCTKVLPQSTLPPPSRQVATTETAKLPMHHPSLESYTICHRHHLQYTITITNEASFTWTTTPSPLPPMFI